MKTSVNRLVEGSLAITDAIALLTKLADSLAIKKVR